MFCFVGFFGCLELSGDFVFLLLVRRVFVLGLLGEFAFVGVVLFYCFCVALFLSSWVFSSVSKNGCFGSGLCVFLKPAKRRGRLPTQRVFLCMYG